MPTHSQYEQWRRIKSDPRVDWKWDELVEAAQDGYKTSEGVFNFLLDVGNYLFKLHCGEKVPHSWDKLVTRAKAHNCIDELRDLRRVFEYERLLKLKFANEGTEEFEFNLRSDLPF